MFPGCQLLRPRSGFHRVNLLTRRHRFDLMQEFPHRVPELVAPINACWLAGPHSIVSNVTLRSRSVRSGLIG